LLKIFGITLVMLGVLACALAMFIGATILYGDYQGLAAIAISIAAVGIVGAGAAILRNFRPD
jgi:type VI protein secretion system component VasK